MKVKLVLSFLVLFGTIGCLNFNYFTGGGSTQSQDTTTIFSKGKTYVKLEEMRSTKGTSGISLDHPKYLRSEILSSVLASIYFKEKGIRGWGKEQNVFQESELFNIVPHITDAFSRAAPSQYVLVSSNYTKGKRFFKSELYTIFGLFVSNDKLNVMFSRIQYEPIIERGESAIFTNSEAVYTDPFSIKKNPFWKLIPHPGQRLKEGNSNWLIIDLEEGSFVKKEEYGKEVALSGQLEVSNARGEQEGSIVSDTKEIVSGSPKRVEAKVSIKDQLLELKELETSGLITREDYERRKAEILVGKPEKSIKKKFIELRKLKEGGFIGDIDYEHKKRDLLDEDDESERNIKEILAEYLELRDEGFITDKDYDYKKKKLLREF
ncbi:MAG: SHOCT domain-containing protein [Candidatus Scalinduaceae bacterium]